MQNQPPNVAQTGQLTYLLHSTIIPDRLRLHTQSALYLGRNRLNYYLL